MVGQGCIATVKRALLSVSGVMYAAVYLHSETALVTGSAPAAELAAAVLAAGKFVLTPFERSALAPPAAIGGGGALLGDDVLCITLAVEDMVRACMHAGVT